jgi:hypothetical protein
LVENQVTAPLDGQRQASALLKVWMLMVGGVIVERNLVIHIRPREGG